MLKKIKQRFEDEKARALESGDVLLANRIDADYFIATLYAILGIAFIITTIGVACRFLPLSVSYLPVCITITAIVFIIYAAMVKAAGRSKWPRNVGVYFMLLVVVFSFTIMGDNPVLLIMVPVMLSIRYYDSKFTGTVSVLTSVGLIAATVANAFVGEPYPSKVDFGTSTVLTVSGTGLIQAVKEAGYDRQAYLISMLKTSCGTKLLLLAVLFIVAVQIAGSGKKMIEQQRDITKKGARIETELNLATDIQIGMLPCVFPAFPDHNELELYAKNLPAKEVGGDFYDYFRIDDDHVALVMADVSGKGVGAALFMTIAKIVLKNMLMIKKSPGDALKETNNQLCENNEAGMFVTCWAGIYEVSTGVLTYANAGHNPPVVIRGGQKGEYLQVPRDLVLAVMEDMTYREMTTTLETGDEIYLYTDGVTEAQNKQNELFAEDRLLECIDRHFPESVKDQIQNIYKDIDVFVDGAEQFDDITMLGMKIQ